MQDLLTNKSLFWDVDLTQLDQEKHSDYIISRVLEEGKLEEVRELLDMYDHNKIANVVRNSRKISPKTGYFWKNYFNIDSDIVCIKKHSQGIPKMPWQR